jgi:pyrroline-5-carboxylate reductase
VPPEIARELVLETTRGAAEMSLANPERELAAMLDSLAAPGHVTRHGLEVLEERESLAGWVAALDVVLNRLHREA